MTWIICHGWRVIAIIFGVSLTSVEIALNTTYMAAGGDWFQPMAIATALVTASGTIAIPIAKRAWRTGAKVEGALLVAFFLPIVLLFSFTASLERAGTRRDNQLAETRTDARRQTLAQETYNSALTAKTRDCADRKDGTPVCRRAESVLTKANLVLQSNLSNAAQRFEDGLATRLTAILSHWIDERQVELYVPILMPVALLLGGFLFLGIGLSPGPEKPVTEAPELPHAGSGFATKDQALERLVRLATHSKGGHRFTSVRGLAKTVNAHPASFALWFREWRGKKFAVDSEGKTSLLRLAKIRAVA